MIISLGEVAGRKPGSIPGVSLLAQWQLVLGIVLAAQGAVILLLSAVYAVPVYVVYLTRDSLATKLSGQTVTAPAIHELLRLNMAYPVAGLLLATAVIYILAATVWRPRYEAWLKQGRQPLRWLVVALAGAVLVVTTGLLAGVRDIANLAAFVAFMVLAGLAGWCLSILSSSRRGRNQLAENLAVIVAIVAGFMPWLTIVRTLFATNIFGSIAAPAYLWWLVGTAVMGWLLFAAIVYLPHSRKGVRADFLSAERLYIALVFLVETAFVWQVFAAVLRPS